MRFDVHGKAKSKSKTVGITEGRERTALSSDVCFSYKSERLTEYHILRYMDPKQNARVFLFFELVVTTDNQIYATTHRKKSLL